MALLLAELEFQVEMIGATGKSRSNKDGALCRSISACQKRNYQV